jgi:hypothetical protein
MRTGGFFPSTLMTFISIRSVGFVAGAMRENLIGFDRKLGIRTLDSVGPLPGNRRFEVPIEPGSDVAGIEVGRKISQFRRRAIHLAFQRTRTNDAFPVRVRVSDALIYNFAGSCFGPAMYIKSFCIAEANARNAYAPIPEIDADDNSGVRENASEDHHLQAGDAAESIVIGQKECSLPGLGRGELDRIGCRRSEEQRETSRSPLNSHFGPETETRLWPVKPARIWCVAPSPRRRKAIQQLTVTAKPTLWDPLHMPLLSVGL